MSDMDIGFALGFGKPVQMNPCGEEMRMHLFNLVEDMKKRYDEKEINMGLASVAVSIMMKNIFEFPSADVLN